MRTLGCPAMSPAHSVDLAEPRQVWDPPSLHSHALATCPGLPPSHGLPERHCSREHRCASVKPGVVRLGRGGRGATGEVSMGVLVLPAWAAPTERAVVYQVYAEEGTSSSWRTGLFRPPRRGTTWAGEAWPQTAVGSLRRSTPACPLCCPACGWQSGPASWTRGT